MKKIILFIVAVMLLSFVSAQDSQAQREMLISGSGYVSIVDTNRHALPDINCAGLLIRNLSATDTLYVGGDNLIKANGFIIAPGESFRFYPISNMKMVYYKSKSGTGALNYFYGKY